MIQSANSTHNFYAKRPLFPSITLSKYHHLSARSEGSQAEASLAVF